MFLREMTMVDVPIAVARPRLSRVLRFERAIGWARDALSAARDMLGIRGFAELEAVETLEPYQRGRVDVIQMRWIAFDDERNRSTLLHGSFEVTATEDNQTCLALLASVSIEGRDAGRDAAAALASGSALVRQFINDVASAIMNDQTVLNERKGRSE
ncbi:hypothetical protein BH09ACT6_BH09ACT6_06250 [soil metagenome]